MTTQEAIRKLEAEIDAKINTPERQDQLESQLCILKGSLAR